MPVGVGNLNCSTLKASRRRRRWRRKVRERGGEKKGEEISGTMEEINYSGIVDDMK